MIIATKKELRLVEPFVNKYKNQSQLNKHGRGKLFQIFADNNKNMSRIDEIVEIEYKKKKNIIMWKEIEKNGFKDVNYNLFKEAANPFSIKTKETRLNRMGEASHATSKEKIGSIDIILKRENPRSLSECIKIVDIYIKDDLEVAKRELLEYVLEYFVPVSGKIEWSVFNIENIEKDINIFIDNLVYEKSFTGYVAQKTMLAKLSKLTNKEWRNSSDEEDKRGIDGFIGHYPISVKPLSYIKQNFTNSMFSNTKGIKKLLVLYETKKDGLLIIDRSSKVNFLRKES